MNIDEVVSAIASGHQDLGSAVDKLLEAGAPSTPTKPGPVRKFAGVTAKNVAPEKRPAVAENFKDLKGKSGEERLQLLRDIAAKRKGKTEE